MTDQQGWLPLTAGQMDFWGAFPFHPDQPVLMVAHCIKLPGAPDESALADTIGQTVAEASTLALIFCETADVGVLQRVDPARALPLRPFDLRDAGAPFGRLADFLAEEIAYTAISASVRERAYWTKMLTSYRVSLSVLRKGTEDYGIAPMRAGFTPDPDTETACQAMTLRLRGVLTLLSAMWPDAVRSGSGGKGPHLSGLAALHEPHERQYFGDGRQYHLVDLRFADRPVGEAVQRLAVQLCRHCRRGRYRVEDMARDCGTPGASFSFHAIGECHAL